MIKVEITEEAKAYLCQSTFVDYEDAEEIIQHLIALVKIESVPTQRSPDAGDELQ